jgi:hypothetical protein
VLIVFVLMYFYFASSRRKPKLQKHIIWLAVSLSRAFAKVLVSSVAYARR